MPSTFLPVGIANQVVNRPTNPAVPSTASYEDAMRAYVESVPGTVVCTVEPENIAAAIIRFLENSSEDEGSNFARYFPAVQVARLARYLADDINAHLACS